MRTRLVTVLSGLATLGLALTSTVVVAQSVDLRAHDRQQSVDTQLVPGLSPRYLVTLMKSCCDTCIVGETLESATDVSVANQTNNNCEVAVEAYDKDDPLNPICTEQLTVPPRGSVDFCTRDLHPSVSVCDVVCSVPEGQGTIVVSSSGGSCENIAVSARVYYYEQATLTYTFGFDEQVPVAPPPILQAITDSKVVKYGRPNTGD